MSGMDAETIPSTKQEGGLQQTLCPKKLNLTHNSQNKDTVPGESFLEGMRKRYLQRNKRVDCNRICVRKR